MYELLRILDAPVAGDARLLLAHQLIPAWLNIAMGSNPVPIGNVLTDTHLVLLGKGRLPAGASVSPSSADGRRMVIDASLLELYNTGLLTPRCTQ